MSAAPASSRPMFERRSSIVFGTRCAVLAGGAAWKCPRAFKIEVLLLEAAIGGDVLDRYERALTLLREEEARLVHLRVELNFSYEEIAAVLARPSPEAARMATQRALRNGGDHGTWGLEDPRHDRAADGVDDIAGSILDGRHVDWNRVDTEPGLDAVTVRALRDLERITEFSRELQETQLAPKGSNPLPASETERWGDLTLLELIGTGARGEVWRAWDPTLQRDVALKFLQPSVQAAGRDARAALLDEARALARVRHPGVVTVYGIAEHGGRVGMWMEYLRGATLAQEIERRGALSCQK